MLRVAAWCIAHRRRVVLAWLGVLVLAVAATAATGSDYQNVFNLPGTESQRARDLLTERFPAQAGDSVQVVFRADRGTLRDPTVRVRIDRALRDVGRTPKVAGVTSPLLVPGAISRDGRTGFATVNFSVPTDKLTADEVRPVIRRAQAARAPGLRVELGGQPIQLTQQSPPGSSEGIGLLAAAVILVMTFGSLVAAGLPLGTAIVALGTGLSLVGVLSTLIDVADFAPQLAAMIGLGVGIDYALFIVTRYREELARGRPYAEAALVAMRTAGRAVLFAGTTVMIALLGMMLLGISFLYGLALASSLAVVLTMIGALTLLPALLVMLGPKIDRLRLGRKPRTGAEGRGWARWSEWVARHPWPAALVGLVVLLAICAPALGLRLGSSDAGSDRASTTTRKAYDLLAQGFGAGFNGPLLLAVELPRTGAKPALARLHDRIAREPGIARVTSPSLNPARDTAVLLAYPRTSPQSAATTDLLDRLRGRVVPGVERATGLVVSIGGATATFEDFNGVVASKLPLFIGIVVALSLLLLLAVFRSVLVPLKAAAMNILSIGASFGVVTAVFQHGWGASLIGVDSTGPIESFLPVMVFAIVFGLSMDYEVFLMSRVHEEWERTGDARRAVTRGLASTGRVITAAATIMVLVFASFILLPDRVIKLFGLGLASAVFLDAFLIRSLVVPAIMHLLGARAWWLPRWLDRRLPRVALEDPELEPARP